MKKALIFLGGVATGGAALAVGELIWVSRKLAKFGKSLHLNDSIVRKFNELVKSGSVENMDQLVESMLNELNEKQITEILSVLHSAEEKTNEVIVLLEQKLEQKMQK